jgi:hypothetical protein
MKLLFFDAFDKSFENVTVLGFRYGYVTPEDVPEILEKHIGLGQVVDRLWR